ncbi:MAG: hypothetical protein L0K86_05290 [Actinomycetia bacterium]|nr:hypothetical protein [Actinomycetes bacterium]
MVKLHWAWRTRHAQCSFTMVDVNIVTTVAGVTFKPSTLPRPDIKVGERICIRPVIEPVAV